MKKSGHAASLRRQLVNWIAGGGHLAAFAREHPERSERQYRRWASTPEFKEELRQQSAEMTQIIVRRLTNVSTMATAELRKLLADKDPAIRLGAVRTALRTLVVIKKTADLDERVSRLEEEAHRAKP